MGNSRFGLTWCGAITLRALTLDDNGKTEFSKHTYKCKTFDQAVRTWLRWHVNRHTVSVLLEDYHSGNRFNCNFDYPVHGDSDSKDNLLDPCDWRPFP